MAKILAGSWRQAPPPLRLTPAELESVADSLLASGAAGLARRQASFSAGLVNTEAAARLQEASRSYAIQDAIRERAVAQAFISLRAAGVEPILAKGWAVARSYPQSWLRPSGDLDLLVRPEQRKTVEKLLAKPELAECVIDLHERFFELEDRTLDELFARSRLVRLGDVDIRILSPEDHVALLSMHLLKHGAWRPLWLCDLGAVLESLPGDFNWDLCLGRNPRRARWIGAALQLAHELLHARIEGTPIAAMPPLPRWVVPAVLRAWQKPHPLQWTRVRPFRIWHLQPGGVRSQLSARWTDPISATVEMNAPLNAWPRLPFQLADLVVRAVKFGRKELGQK